MRLKKVNIEEKEEIARRLFDDYLKKSSTTTVEGKTLNDYKINNVLFTKGDDNKYTVDACYDIQYIGDGAQWRAGNGYVADDKWVKEKDNYLDIE